MKLMPIQQITYCRRLRVNSVQWLQYRVQLYRCTCKNATSYGCLFRWFFLVSCIPGMHCIMHVYYIMQYHIAIHPDVIVLIYNHCTAKQYTTTVLLNPLLTWTLQGPLQVICPSNTARKIKVLAKFYCVLHPFSHKKTALKNSIILDARGRKKKSTFKELIVACVR